MKRVNGEFVRPATTADIRRAEERMARRAEQQPSSAFWTGTLAAAIAWYLAGGSREDLERAWSDYAKRGASDEVRAHLEAIWKEK